MILDFYQNLPLHIDPIAFSVGSFSVRWYALSYIVGFGGVYLVLMWRMKKGELNSIFQISPRRDKLEAKNFKFLPDGISLEQKISNEIPNPKSQIANKDALSNIIFDYLLISFAMALVGGRVGYVLFYNAEYFFTNPLAIISPFDQGGNLIGFYGMSYHGAVLGIVIGSWIFLKKKKINFFAWADFIVPAAAAGYFFGRIGNFLNGELYGRVTDSPLGMYFAADRLNLRHPSQLYEALLEGALLFVVLWNMRHGEFKKGILFGAYLTGYGLLRIFVEKLREPDAQIGFLCNYLTMGQLLSFIMVLGGLLVMIPKKEK